LVLASSLLTACGPASNDSKVSTPNDAPTPSKDAAPTTSAKSGEAAAKANDSTSPSPQWRINDKPIALKSALMKSYGGQMRTLYLSNEDLTCEKVKGHGSVSYNDTLMTIEISPSFKAKSPPLVKVTYPTSDKRITPKSLEEHALKMPPSAVQGIVSMPIDLNFKDTRMEMAPEQNVFFKGTVDLKDCGVFPSGTDAESMPQPKLKLEVSGESVEIKGVLLLNDEKEPRLVLTSEPNSCNRDSFSDVVVELRYKGTSDLTFAVLMGNRLDSAYQTSRSDDLKRIKSKIPAKLPKVGSKLEIRWKGSSNCRPITS
jgi:hypothetical protein